jgi:hypothetical protein
MELEVIDSRVQPYGQKPPAINSGCDCLAGWGGSGVRLDHPTLR